MHTPHVASCGKEYMASPESYAFLRCDRENMYAYLLLRVELWEQLGSLTSCPRCNAIGTLTAVPLLLLSTSTTDYHVVVCV